MIAENRAGQPKENGKAGLKTKAAVAAALVLLIASGAVLGQKVYAGFKQAKVLDTDAFYSGIQVQGIDLGGKSMKEAKSAVEAALPLPEPVQLTVTDGTQTWQLTQKDLRFQYNTDQILKEAYAYARNGDRKERYRQVKKLQTSPKTYSVTLELEEASLKAALDAIADQVESVPKQPDVVSFHLKTHQFAFSDGTNGVTVDRNQLLKDAHAVLEAGKTGTVHLSTTAEPFSGTLAELKAHMKKLGSFSTVSKNSASGTYNMTKALLAANGTRIESGAVFSFFGTVGPCGQAQGYRPAGAILNGKLVQEYGGGICQASTTIYGAAVRSGMEITERHNHTIPSSYCKIGQDATVSYSSLDLKFTNLTEYPVYLVTTVKNRVLTATLYGYQPDGYDSIGVNSRVTSTIPAPSQAQYVLDSSLKKGEIRLMTKARTGYKVTASRIYLKNGAAVKTENLPASYYRAQPAFYSYGKGTNLASVPAGKPASAPSSSKPVSSQASSQPGSSSQASSLPSSSSLSSQPDSSSPSSQPKEEQTNPVSTPNENAVDETESAA
ncbi:MAG: VanW family protein [Oscillospiraceae bacterium]|nr:VanW family protein [Oscillospiraceae bacterium]